MAKYMLPFVLLLIAVFAWAAEKTGDTRMMTATQLLPMLGKPDLIIIDVRTSYEWDKSKVKIKGAVREEGMKFGSWMNKYPKEKTIVLYCAWVNDSTSVSLTQAYAKAGWNNVYALKGSTIKGAWEDWIKAGYPTEPK